MISAAELIERLDLYTNDDRILVRARESTDLEFKLELTENVFKKCLKTIAAFASKSGGRIVFGIQDRPRILSGLAGRTIDEAVQSSLISDCLVPAPDHEFSEFVIQGRTIGVLEVSPLVKKPCMAAKEIADGPGRPSILRMGTVYARRRGQTAPISSNEFIQILSERDESVRGEILSFIARGASVGFERAIVADASRANEGQEAITYYLPFEAAKGLNVIDRARVVSAKGAPAYEIQGNIELTIPSRNDPRLPLLSGDSVRELEEQIRAATLPDLPFTPSHLRKAAEHLGFWKNADGDGRNTGFESLTNRPIYYSEGRTAILEFARNNPKEFLEVSASKANIQRWNDAEH